MMEWRSISEKYECSNEGHIRSKKTKRVLKEFKHKDGYLRTQFDGKTRTVHRVIAEAFLEKEYGKDFINHKDGNKKNNNVENLEWCTRSENIQHAYDNGLIRRKKGEMNGRSKLTSQEVQYIKEHYIPKDKNYGAKALSKKFNVATQTICAAYHGQNWGNI